MPTHRSGTGDPVRTLELLWRAPGAGVNQRGPRQTLSVDRVVAAAIGVADAEGVEAVTMRRIAQALGVAPMSLYTYVPGKAELLDLMIDTVCGQMTHSQPPDGSWRARLTAIADDNRALHERHPWLITVSTARPPLGPGVIEKYDRELAALDGLGLADVEMDAALTFLLGFVESTARAAAAARTSQQDSTLDEQQWWEASAPLLERVFDAERYPTAARVGAAAGAAYEAAADPEHAYAFGLGRLLDGLGVLIDSRAG
ncbi:MAG TPA: TetR/AcrR family transcriptional regulator [Pilimelia sp.]|nr:TetR/AcrR family transcriptional regulator [Pilimelia sp.]